MLKHLNTHAVQHRTWFHKSKYHSQSVVSSSWFPTTFCHVNEYSSGCVNLKTIYWGTLLMRVLIEWLHEASITAKDYETNKSLTSEGESSGSNDTPSFLYKLKVDFIHESRTVRWTFAQPVRGLRVKNDYIQSFPSHLFVPGTQEWLSEDRIWSWMTTTWL